MNIRSEAEYRGIVFSDEIWDGRLLQRTVFEACVFERCQFEAGQWNYVALNSAAFRIAAC